MDKVTALCFYKFSTSIFCDLKPNAWCAVPVLEQEALAWCSVWERSVSSERNESLPDQHLNTNLLGKRFLLEQLSSGGEAFCSWVPPQLYCGSSCLGLGSPVAPQGCRYPMGLEKAAVVLFTPPEGAGRAHLGSSLPALGSFRKFRAYAE